MDLKRFLDEDVGSGDMTARIFVPDAPGRAVIVCEEDAVAAGVEEAIGIFALLGVSAEAQVQDGDKVAKGATVITLSGPLKGIITGERTALNFLMIMSGIATATSSVVEKIRTKDKNVIIAGTRKTTPGFRAFEKKAISLGGGWPHRNGLYDMVLIKDNHIAAGGGINAALGKIKKVPIGTKIEIEVTTVKDGVTAAKSGADIIMADHLSPRDTQMLRSLAKAVRRDVQIEASGNITPENAVDYAGCADIISIGALTHSSRAIHYSLDIDLSPPKVTAAPEENEPKSDKKQNWVFVDS
ncbi:MAG: carboxylating nicotinate-nucleotide diphosphorylase [Candidatus Methanoplasma sp.]|jgi:nicotinate-nucleotide pyrophosphorylase (carboxylating)|nr:carboxylating nicotinate-nucleotide diphosphorylase [Candidatus Methanoplasma sp.]